MPYRTAPLIRRYRPPKLTWLLRPSVHEWGVLPPQPYVFDTQRQLMSWAPEYPFAVAQPMGKAVHATLYWNGIEVGRTLCRILPKPQKPRLTMLLYSGFRFTSQELIHLKQLAQFQAFYGKRRVAVRYWNQCTEIRRIPAP